MNAQIDLTSSYTQLQPAIEATVRQFCRTYGGDFEEKMADASLIFVEACAAHDESRGTLKGRIKYLVWHRLLDARRSELTDSKRYSVMGDDGLDLLTQKPDPAGRFDVRNFLNRLSEDAQLVVQLTIAPTDAMRAAFGSDLDPPHIRRVISDHLRTQLRWFPDRVREAFLEIELGLEE